MDGTSIERSSAMPVAVTHLLGPDQGEVVHLLALGVRFMIDGERTGGAFSLVEHPLPPRALGAPLHTHHNEDEHSFVLQGRFGVQLGDDTLEAGPGDLLFKPRGVPHAFWNAGDEPARLLELISPAGFEHYFRGLAPLLATSERDQAPSTRSSPATSSTSTSPPSLSWPNSTTCDWDELPLREGQYQ
jgi:mannose-6-phosphate isomerase-like protein (cupin superfamily)